MGQLEGKVALVTGSAHGIGKATAFGLAKEGAILVLADKDAEGLKKVESDLLEAKAVVESLVIELSKEDQILYLFQKILTRFKRLDILINNAGVFDSGLVENLESDVWDYVMAVNLRAPFICTREAFKIMKPQGGGRIINIGSISAQRVRSSNAAYSSSKFGLVGLTHTTALEGRQFGINCGCLHPGNTRHDVMPGLSPWEKEAMMTQNEVAAAAVYMACLPSHINVLEMVQMPREQLFLGRG